MTHKHLPDFAEFITASRAREYENAWIRDATYHPFATVVNTEIDNRRTSFSERGEFTVVEFCCRSGWLPTLIYDDVVYVGVEDNPHFYTMAVDKNRGNPLRYFIHADIRNVKTARGDLVCCFHALKNFAIREWHVILERILTAAPVAIFTAQVLEDDDAESFDDGTEFHHVWLRQSFIPEHVERFGHRVTDQRILWSGAVPSRSYFGKEVLFVTKKV